MHQELKREIEKEHGRIFGETERTETIKREENIFREIK